MDVRRIQMSEWIKKLTEAYSEVNESQKAAMAKKLAKASAGSEKGKADVTLPKAPFDIPKKVEKMPIQKKEAADMNKANADKAIQHDCATHVEHAEWGKGQPISEQHTIVETAPGVGYVTHYDVMFEHGIEKNVAVKDLDILAEMSHGHSKKKKNEAMDPVNHKELKGKHKDRKDGDIDNDGDEDESDKYLHRRRKAVSKSMKKENDVEMNPKKTKDKASTQNADTMESTVPTVYARILEARAMHYKGAAPAQDKEDGMAPMTKKTKKDMEAGMKVDDTEEKGHDDASKAGRAGPKAKARSGDNMKGDKSVMNPAKDTTKAG